MIVVIALLAFGVLTTAPFLPWNDRYYHDHYPDPCNRKDQAR